ncbi:ribonuclease H-like domain-containing protein [Tanacetum coccineum]|uniref:Ribonuclease H-like domain-containing protein n=1 Tax=Tanacetum coccineum TaxID=301880 RepID=A0ABQ5ILW9_9ASTR
MNDKPSSSSLSSGFTPKQMQKLLSMINDKPSRSIHANMAGRASFFNGWIIDSGANQHLTILTARIYNVVDIFKLKVTVGYPNGTLATISHVRNFKLTNNVILYDVPVLGYCVSLLSLNNLIRDSKMFVAFNENKCKSNVVMCFHVSKLLWHNRLGYPVDQVLSLLKNDLSISDNSSVPMCEVCQRAKQTREPFPLSDHKSKTLVNDYSKAVWVYLVKIKDEVFDVFVSYIKMIHNQFDVKIKTVRLPSSVLNGKYPLSWSEKYVLIGYSTNKKAYKLLSLDSRNVFYSRDVKLYENIFPFKRKTCDSTDMENTSEVEHLQFFNGQLLQSPNDDGKDSSVEDGSLPHYDSSNSTQVQTPILRRSDRQSKLPVRLNDYVLNSNVKYGTEKYVNYSKLNSVNLCFATTLNNSVEPSCLFEAMSHPNWVESMDNEIKALNRNNTLTISDLPIGRKPIGSKWIWKIKYKASGEIERCLIGFAIVSNWPLYQLDVNNAFLYGDLVEDVYMTLPDSYNNEDRTKVCKLNSLYGLKQAPRQWNVKLTTALAEHGFEQSKFDYSLYTKHNGYKFVAYLVYIDDIVITRNDDVGIKEFKLFLSTKFIIKDLGILKYFLGIEIIENDIGLYQATSAIETPLNSPMEQCGASAIRHHLVGAKRMLIPKTSIDYGIEWGLGVLTKRSLRHFEEWVFLGGDSIIVVVALVTCGHGLACDLPATGGSRRRYHLFLVYGAAHLDCSGMWYAGSDAAIIEGFIQGAANTGENNKNGKIYVRLNGYCRYYVQTQDEQDIEHLGIFDEEKPGSS